MACSNESGKDICFDVLAMICSALAKVGHQKVAAFLFFYLHVCNATRGL
jgi:hypothetical protein